MRIIHLALIMGLGLLLSVSCLAGDAEMKMETVAEPTVVIGETALDFTLADPSGDKYTLSDYRGKFVVLEWINFDCPFVKKHYGSENMPALQSKYRGKDVVWLSICSSAPGKQGNFSGENLQKRITESGSKATAYLVDQDGKVGKMYEAKTTPHMFVIDTMGVLIYAGAIDNKPSTKVADIAESVNYVQLALDAAMKGEEVATKATQPYGCSVKY